ncbi:MAG: hypothetical protein QOK44_2036, partial [Betaproteobacteria bacterium]|nr:hypothetical protein [Betaproteobacteria bacterium]
VINRAVIVQEIHIGGEQGAYARRSCRCAADSGGNASEYENERGSAVTVEEIALTSFNRRRSMHKETCSLPALSNHE